MSLRDQFRSIANTVRQIPGDLGLRPYTVEIVRTTSAGTEQGRGVQTEVAITVRNGTANPRVRWLSDEQLALGGYEQGTVQIGPITPSYGTGGTALASIYPSLGNDETLRVRLTGPRHPSGGWYRIIKPPTGHRALRYMLTVQRAE